MEYLTDITNMYCYQTDLSCRSTFNIPGIQVRERTFDIQPETETSMCWLCQEHIEH
uniref:Uncharacterized protein n=1 Tax=Arion vulgaris TaxID=1028688 RepID=A0A0B6YSH3_9EUPU